MDEKDIKAEALNYLLDSGKIARRCVIANEYALAKSSARADLAILSGSFIGVEVKSAKDSLKRLDLQMSAYKKYFDIVILIVASKHLRSLNFADYSGVEIIEIDAAGKFHVLSEKSDQNKIEEGSLHDLLTQTEKRRFYGAPKNALQLEADKITENNYLTRLAFNAAFTARYMEKSEIFWRQVRRKKIKAKDLEILSRYREQRQMAVAIQEQRKLGWANWINEINQLSLLINEPV